MTYVRWSTIGWPWPVELVAPGGARRWPSRPRSAKPWPSGPVVASTPGVRPCSGWPGRDAAPLPERLEVLERDLVAGQVEERVEQHAGVAGGQHEPVAIGPVGAGRRVAQEPRPQDVGHRRGAHRGARMPGIRLLDGVDREGPDRVDRQLVEVGGDGHRAGSLAAWAGHRTWSGHCSGGPAILRACRPIRAPGDRADRHAPGARDGPAVAAGRRPHPRIVVLGDLMLDVVLAPAVPLDVGHGRAGPRLARPGRLGGEHGALARPARGTLEPHRVGRTRCRRPGARGGDPAATACTPRVSRVAGARTGRIGVLVAPGGERSFVADRGAADLLAPGRPAARPGSTGRTRSTCRSTRCSASRSGWPGRRAIDLARDAGAAVSVDLASIGPLLAGGRRAARALIARRRARPAVRDGRRGRGVPRRSARRRAARLRPDGGGQARAEGRDRPDPARADAGRGSRSPPSTWPSTDTTGAGDAFDAGFLVGWFAARAAGRSAAGLAPARGRRRAPRRGTPAVAPRPELPLG